MTTDGWAMPSAPRATSAATEGQEPFWHKGMWANIALLALFVVMSISFYLKSDVKEVAQPTFYDLLLVPMVASFFLFGLKIPKGLAWPMLFWGLLLVGYTVGSFNAHTPGEARDYTIVVIYLILTFIFFTSVICADPRRHLQLLWNGYLLAAFIAAAIGTLAYFHAIPNAEFFLRYDRPTATFNDPNVFGPYLVAPVLYVLHKLTLTRKARDIFLLPVVGTIILALFLSFSRGAWANLIASLLLYVGFMLSTPHGKQQTDRLLFLLIGIGVVSVVVISWALSDPTVSAHFIDRFSLVQSYDVEEQGRFWTQARAIEVGMSNPLGLGPAQWPGLYSRDPHNVYLSIFVAGGYLSLLSYLGFLILTIVRGFRALKVDFPGRSFLMISLAVTIAHVGEAMIIDVDNWRHLYFLFGSCWGCILTADRFKAMGGSEDGIMSRGISSQNRIVTM
ncbi:MAG: hypothetical protein COB70_005935 [Rhodobiaceae bacterium]|nr:hypothetical protein [Rhodobiaceae bacterium]